MIRIVLLQLIVFYTYAQLPELKFNLVEDPGGKPLGKIRDITQDPYGYMWFAGEGARCLYRYDGNQLIRYAHDDANTNSLGGNMINSVYADSSGIIWVGLENGLDRYNPATNTFKHYRHSDDPGSLMPGSITPVLRDHQGTLWVGGTGVDRLDEKTGKFIHYRHDPNNQKSLSSDIVWNLYVDRHGVLWIATGKAFYNVGKDWDEGGLNRLEPDGTFTQFKHSADDPHSLISNKVRAMFEDSRGNFWVGTSGDGLHIMNRKTGKFERLTYDPERPDKISRPPLKSGDFAQNNDQITFIHEDVAGSIWIGTMWSGINRYDTLTKKITHYEKSNGFPDGGAWNVFQSRDGVLWIATQEDHVVRVDPFRKDIPLVRTERPVHRFLEDDYGYLWVTTSGDGLLQYDKHNKLIRKFKHDDSDSTSLSSDDVSELFRDQAGNLWVGTVRGLDILDESSGKFHTVPLPASTKSKGEMIGKPMTIVRNKNIVWFTSWGDGLFRYDLNTHTFKNFMVDATAVGDYTVNHLAAMLADTLGNLWIGNPKGLVKFDTKHEKFMSYLDGMLIPDLYRSSDGVMWAATGKGLFYYDYTGDKFVPYFNAQESISNELLFAITEDSTKNLWLTTQYYIVSLNTSGHKHFIYGPQYGIIYPTVASLLGSASGKIFVGSEFGFYHFFPKELEVKTSFSIRMSGLSINSRPAMVGKDSTLQHPIEEIRELQLAYNQNNFSFWFAVDDYRAPESIRYYAMMEGYDTWHEVVGEKRSDFFSMSSGTYHYKLRAYNLDGRMAEKQITIIVSPPWWRTWWAYAAYFIVALTALALGRKMIIQRERLKLDLKWSQLEREKERIQLEKAKEVDKIKTSFFTNISHEFRTPLTLIKGPAQNLLDKFSNNANISDQLRMIDHNADILLKLVNQLLDLAKLEAGTVMIKNAISDLSLFLKILTHSLSSAALQKEIAYLIELPEAQYEANFDRDKLETILLNLIGNAIKFTPHHGRVIIKAAIEMDDETKMHHLVFSVSDTGPGIHSDHKDKIFDRFFQLNENMEHYKIGTGIGLALVKELTELLKGKVSVESQVGRGSEFIVRLPIEITNIQQQVTPISEALHDELDDFDLLAELDVDTTTKETILIVEDHADLRRFIISSLGSTYHYLEAEDGKTALEIALREIPQLIISDVMMPVMDGISLVQKIRKDIRTSHIPVIFLTAKATEDDKLTGLETGAQDYLTKPFNKNELTMKVRNIVDYSVKIGERMRLDLLSKAPSIEVVSADEQFLVQLKEAILARLGDEQLSVDSLAREVGWSRAQFYRKVKALTGVSANELIRNFRLQKGAQLIEQKWGSVSQVAYEVGFSNPSYFSKCFKAQFGVYPSDYQPTPQI